MKLRPALAVVLFAALFLVAARTAALADCDASVGASSIFFVTDRLPLPDDPYFSGERGKTPARVPIISYGVATAPLSGTTLHTCSSRAAFFAAVRRRFHGPFQRSALIYIHGYYRNFKQGIETASLLQSNIKFKGPVILYSWPSKQTSRLTYVNDESNANWSMSHFVDLLNEFEGAFPKTTVSLVSHSMGGRFAAAGLEYFRHSPCPKCLGRSIFYAPDVDSDTLYDEFVASGLCSTSSSAKTPQAPSAQITLYVSNRDTALRDSQQLHGHQRAGQAGTELILCDGIDTVDVSYIKGSDSYGHLYQVYPEVLNDSTYAFGGVGPTNPLRAASVAKRPGGWYYELKPSGAAASPLPNAVTGKSPLPAVTPVPALTPVPPPGGPVATPPK
jgi:hypothetical protein